jgi:uncharacterized membrane protein (UPF0127 family)
MRLATRGRSGGTPLSAAWRLRCLGLAAALAAALAGCGPHRLPEQITVEIAGQEFRLEVARSLEEQRQGLMYRRRLGSREGMLFVYTEDRHLSFWMKNTRIPLDLLFLSREGDILQIEELKPGSLKPVDSRRAARYALELARGTAAALGVAPGDRVRMPEGFR